MKIIILCPFWRRPAIAEIWANHIRLLQSCTSFQLVPFVVISQEDEFFNRHVHTVQKHGFDFCFASNRYLGEKMNAGVDEIMHRYREFDYMMNIGSDDLINPELFKVYERYIEKQVPFFGITDLLMHDVLTDETFWVKNMNNGYAIGAGRMIHYSILRDLFEERTMLYPPGYPSGLDTESRTRIIWQGHREEIVKLSETPMVIDLKSPVNIGGIEHWKKNGATPYPYNDLSRHFPGFSNLSGYAKTEFSA